MIIAIDGPAGTGKSSVTKKVAELLNFTYIDTGAMYRALTLYVIQNNININNEDEVKNVCSSIDIEFKNNRVFLNNVDVSEEIRTPKISEKISIISSYPSVREVMVQLQRKMANNYPNIILEGRDIGTVVFPNADKKFFLTASLEERAKRRLKELLEKGISITLEQVKDEIQKRDYYDTTRDIAPLKPAPDAIIIDTTNLTFEEVVNKVINLIKTNE